ncbi:hypothetical protein ACHAWO_006269 [Cyclotella atomus]|uniref:WSC domain-containing protein n=1 Tax=Cyclotella atomus TaxID=382360 RepID=A0ABD3PVG1_9STRA
MKTITTLLLLPLTTAQLRKDETSNDMNRSLQQECAVRSTQLGCYNDKNSDRALPIEIFGPKSRNILPSECEAACASAGYDLWGRQFKGQCFCGEMDATYGFGKHGTASGCDCCGDNVGSNIFCAYALDTTAPGCGDSGVSASSTYVGCYANKNLARALPVEVPGKGWSAQECEAACEERGYEYFAREWKGQCFCGTDGYDVHGLADGCDCCGENVGGNMMCVWHSLS